METEGNVLVFVDEQLYRDWSKTKLPKSDYDLDTFKGKVFRSVNFMEESSFSLYPVIGFVKNLTNRIVKSYLESEKA